MVVPPTANYFVFGVNSYYGTTIYNCLNENGELKVGDVLL